MNAETRRASILSRLQASVGPISAASLAALYDVSRQVIVGDVALLRASGADISATPRGYVLAHEDGLIAYTVACAHTGQDMERELNIMVDNGCTVRDVIVEHPLYGQLTGALDLRSRYDVRQFVLRTLRSDALPLSSLTDGIHLHTLLCPDEDTFLRTRAELKEAGMLLRNDA